MDAPLALKEWSDFYVIIGSSAGALTGLQFVSIALIAEKEAARSTTEIRAFGTPTIVHFCFALVIAAIVCSPWRSLASVGVSLGILGGAGLAYSCNVVGHARRQTGYAPDLEDWCWYVAFPLIAYATLLVSGIALAWHPTDSLFIIAAVALALVLIGIHNAWDTVTYVALTWRKPPGK
ncbi:MAG TPA: hypothetical protein VFA85_09075 [Terriglobales bacterium]|nr:hypothetical protein [Terriglobales bacterium]